MLTMTNQTDITNQGIAPTRKSLVWIVISRGILAACLTAVPDPMTILLLGIMAGIALVMTWLGKPAAARVRVVKAAIYGVAAIVVYIYVSNDLGRVDMLAGKLEEYKRQHEVYPDQLVAMVPALLPAIPKPGLTGLKYSRRADTNSYALYYKSSPNRTCYYTPETKLRCHVD